MTIFNLAAARFYPVALLFNKELSKLRDSIARELGGNTFIVFQSLAKSRYAFAIINSLLMLFPITIFLLKYGLVGQSVIGVFVVVFVVLFFLYFPDIYQKRYYHPTQSRLQKKKPLKMELHKSLQSCILKKIIIL